MAKNIDCVILAAGLSSRMQTQKLLLPFSDVVSIVCKVALTAMASQVRSVVAVINPAYPEVRNQLLALDVQVVENEHANVGISSSFRCAVDAFFRLQADAGVFLLGDQPYIQSETIDQIVSVYQNTTAKIVQACYEGTPGHPVLLDKSLFPYGNLAQGDEGGRSLIRHFSELRRLVDADLPYPEDIDTPEDYQRMILKTQKFNLRKDKPG